ncbi:MAG: type II toxin-antitoxin system RelE/ParE family toxin [Magnetococcales bacterium]|nr:type II toxin-antitoxin system RelE/ParE family toxin [Magnetococcales bacterium]
MNVVVTEAAKADLWQLCDFIRRDNPVQALTFADDLLTCCQLRADTPRAYPLVPRYEHHGIRRRTFQNDLIFYRLTKNDLPILRILHGARDYESLLFR